MCDAWLGRAAAGDTSPEVVYHLYRTSTLTLFREQRRLGLPQRALSGRFQTGLYLDYPLSTKTEMWLAYAASMIGARDFDEAEQVLDKLDQATTASDGDTSEIRAYIRGVLHFTTQRWPDVLSALSRSGSFTDNYIGAGADLMVGSACAQMGLFGEGIRRLDQAVEGPVPGARRAADKRHSAMISSASCAGGFFNSTGSRRSDTGRPRSVVCTEIVPPGDCTGCAILLNLVHSRANRG
jgi:hypothetical protein